MSTQGGKTWGGRFSSGPDALVEAYTESISFDHRLYRHDIAGSQAHARMLAHVGLVSAEESAALVKALGEIATQIEEGRLAWRRDLEDIHTHIEVELISRLGDTGRKLHTGRSRNDQVATAMKLWTRDALDRVVVGVTGLQRAFVDAAEREDGVILPGYTHLQRAQPVLAPHYYLAYVEKLERDRGRLLDARARLNWLPLGAGALAGSSLPLDRAFVARELGFDGVAANSLDVSSDRDFAAEFLFALTLLATHLGGWAEEWVLWATTEFGFLELSDAFCTGSSLMPQKKNPDVLELMRGRTARVNASLQRILVILKGLPLAYNRDLQEDKEAVFDAVDTVERSLAVAAPLVASSRLRRDRIGARLEEGFLDATTLLEHLVKHGMPMRTAHESVGKLVRQCEENRCRLAELPAGNFNSIVPGLAPGVYEVLGVEKALAAFRTEGSTGPKAVASALAAWKARLAAR
ncbi:MAG: argininosuccinate lyase [Planctomycetes bacterium]|nr:argininosuccinate lyase [Planctomycetota bacterium]